MKINLPWPPSVNHYWFIVACKGGGRKVIGKKGKVFREEVREIFGAHNEKQQVGRLSVRIEAYPPDRRKRDLDNLLKATLDALEQAGAYEDDSQIDDLRIIRKDVCKPGKLEITVEEIV